MARERTLAGLRPFVLLEAGRARVVPFEARQITSWVGDWLAARSIPDLPTAPRVDGLRCVHPWVTAIEKIEAIAYRFARPDLPATTFVRHYEDLAWVIRRRGALSNLADGVAGLVSEMRAARDIRGLPGPEHAAFNPSMEGARWREVEDAWSAMAPMFWGPRIALAETCAEVREVLNELARRATRAPPSPR
jgi:hypothetical protein